TVSQKLKISAGLRIDIPMFLNKPQEDTYFNNTVIPKIQSEGYDLQGARVGEMPKPQIMLSPRIGFNYDVTGEQTTQVRGGVGIFTSRIPYVWPGASFNNNGILIGAIPGNANPKVLFRPDPNDQYDAQD